MADQPDEQPGSETIAPAMTAGATETSDHHQVLQWQEYARNGPFHPSTWRPVITVAIILVAIFLGLSVFDLFDVRLLASQ